jgi:hypothetical protein
VESEWHQAGCNIKVQYQGAISRCNIKDKSKGDQGGFKGGTSTRRALGAGWPRKGSEERKKGRKEERKKGRKEERKKRRK